MVPWWGLVLAMIFGGCVGILLLALVSANDDDRRPPL